MSSENPARGDADPNPAAGSASPPEDELSATITRVWGDHLEGAELPEETIAIERASALSTLPPLTRPARLRDRTGEGAPQATAIDDADYELVSIVGQGGMGTVYLARQSSLRRDVALKRPLEGLHGQAGESFLREALVTGELEHPGIVPVHDLAVDETGRPLMSMKLVRGRPWNELLAETGEAALTLRENLDILIRACDAIAFAHSKGIVNRDIKPENVMVGDFGEVFVVDWGIAVDLHSGDAVAKAEPLRRATGPAGTPRYMAPELALGQGELIGPRTDVYLLGACLYELLTGASPHQGKGLTQVLWNAARSAVVDPRERAPDRSVPSKLAETCLRAMARRAEDRFESVIDFQGALREFLEHEASLELTDEAASAFDRLGVDGAVDERRRHALLEEAQVTLAQALRTWPDNPRALELQARVAERHGEEALRAGDLSVARRQVATLEASPLADPARLATLRDGVARSERRRRRARGLLVLLGATLAATLLVGAILAGLFVRRLDDAKRLAEDNLHRARTLGLVAAARTELNDGHPLSSLLLAVEAASLKPAAQQIQILSEVLAQAHSSIELRHGDLVKAAVFSPDGTRLLSGGHDGTARIWDIEGRELAVMDAGGKVQDVAWSPDGSQLLTTTVATAPRLWSADGATFVELTGHEAAWQGAFSPDSSLLITWRGNTKGARVWDRQGREVAVLDAEGRPGVACWSADSRRIATLSGDGRVRIWTRGGRRLAEVTSTHGEVVDMAGSGSRLFTIGGDGSLREWDFEGRPVARHFDFEPAYLMAISPDASLLVMESQVNWGTLLVLNLDGEEVGALRGHSGPVSAARFTSDGSRIATVGYDKSVRLWDVTGHQLAHLRGHRGTVLTVAISPDDQRLLSASLGGAARLWAMSPPDSLALHADRTRLTAIATSADSSRVATGSEDGAVQIWDLDGRLLATGRGHQGTVAGVWFSPDGSHLLSASRDRTVRIWDGAGREVAAVEGQQLGRNVVAAAAAFSPDGERIVTGLDDGSVRIWSLDGRELAALRGHEDRISTACFSPDGAQVLTSSQDGTARLWGRDGDALATFRHDDEVRIARFSPDGSRVLTGSRDGTAAIWSLDGRRLVVLPDQGRLIRSACFLPDGSKVLTADSRGPVRLWASDGRELGVFPFSAPILHDVRALPDGSGWLVSAGDQVSVMGMDGAVRLRLSARAEGFSSPYALPTPDGSRVVWFDRPDVRISRVRGADLLELGRSRLQAIGREFRPDELERFADLLPATSVERARAHADLPTAGATGP